jgi:UDP-glucuronate 4-epimerase
MEQNTGKKAKINYVNFQAGDMLTTYADILKAGKMLKYNPKISIEDGIKKFVKWYLDMKSQGRLFEDNLS